jgi:branched-subunit amino acid transport protein
MGDECHPTYAVTPMTHLKNDARSCLSSLSFRNVIICDNNISLAANKYKTINILCTAVLVLLTKHYTMKMCGGVEA